MSTEKGNEGCLERAAAQLCRREGLLCGVEGVLVGLSGGADSVALTHYLKESCGVSVTACHINHLLRGEESLRDEEFVRELCRSWGIPLRVCRVEVAALAAREGISWEEAGRKARYRFFEQVCGECGADCVATAHTGSDQVETILFQLTRGTAGLGGIPPCRGLEGKGRVIRPLLECSREQVEDYCRRKGLSYVVDSTNLEEVYTRNKIRSRVIPVLEEINPALCRAVLRGSAVSRQEDSFLDKLAGGLLEQGRPSLEPCPAERTAYLELSVMQKAELPLLRRALALFFREKGISISFELLEETAERIRQGGFWRRTLPGGGWLFLSGGSHPRLTLKLERESLFPGMEAPYFESRWEGIVPFHTLLPDGSKLVFEICSADCLFPGAAAANPTDCKQKIYRNLLYLTLDYDRIKGNILIRQRLPGDRISLACGTKTLKKLLNEKKMTALEKSLQPVLTDEMGIIGLPGIAVASRCRPVPGTRRIVRVCWEI